MPAPAVDLGDDEAIARLLAEDAKASSSRYASQGLSALLPRRQAGSAPKPNTRFLKALVRDADSHNAALRRKEDRERVERLRGGGQRTPERPQTSARREKDGRGDDQGRERKRRRLSEDRGDGLEAEEWSRKSASKYGDKSGSGRRHRYRSRSVSGDDESLQRREHRHRRDRKLESRGKSESQETDERSHRKHTRKRSPSPRRDRNKRVSPYRRERRKRRGSSSDPLEEFVGPLPAKEPDELEPVRVRGRGAHKITSVSNIDAHFSSNYDPALDVQPENEQPDDREDWDMALEALRDRQAWKKKHADRMRAAGFGDEEIEKWEESGREKDARDVRWRAKGQVREWDVGKDQLDSGKDDDREGRLTP